jgi:hypothetical protein
LHKQDSVFGGFGTPTVNVAQTKQSRRKQKKLPKVIDQESENLIKEILGARLVNDQLRKENKALDEYVLEDHNSQIV